MTFRWSSLPKPFSVLAPMEDVTDSVFRRIIAECGRPDVFYSEFTSTDGMFSVGEERVVHRLRYTEEERPIIAQIWGNDPEKYYKAAIKLREMGFDGIDINMGCPVAKIVNNGCCSALIDNPNLAKELVLAAKEGAQGIEVSVKTRMGFKSLKTIEWSHFLLELKPSALIMHGRLAKDLSKKPANWDEIGKVVELRNTINSDTTIIGNGDIASSSGIEEVHDAHGVDGVMIGRGIFQDPYLFDSQAIPLVERSPREKLDLLIKHIDLFMEYWKDKKPYRVLKKYFKIYVSSFDGASELRAKLVESDSSDEAKKHIDDFLLRSDS